MWQLAHALRRVGAGLPCVLPEQMQAWAPVRAWHPGTKHRRAIASTSAAAHRRRANQAESYSATLERRLRDSEGRLTDVDRHAKDADSRAVDAEMRMKATEVRGWVVKGWQQPAGRLCRLAVVAL